MIPDQFRLLRRTLPGREVQDPREANYALYLGQIAGVAIEPQRDPILVSGLAPYRDSREYVLGMGTDPDVEEAWRGLTQHVTSEPIEIVAGPSSTPAAKLLADYGEWVWRMLPAQSRRLAQRWLLNAGRWGFAPLQVIQGEGHYRGRRKWIAKRMVDKKPYHLWRTLGPRPEHPLPVEERPLVWSPMDYWTWRVIDPEAARDWWIISRAGSEDSFYGLGAYSAAWPLYELGFTVRRKGWQAVDRELGALTVSAAPGTAVGDNLSEFLEKWLGELKLLVDMWNSDNVLLQVGPLVPELAGDLEFISSFRELLEYCGRGLRRLITGGELGGQAPEGQGSRALAEVHERGIVGRARELAMDTIEPALTDWLATSIRLNMDPEPDPDDLPRVVSRINLAVDDQRVRTWWDLGGAISLSRLAELQGGSGVLVTEEAAGGVDVVRKPEQAPVAPDFSGLTRSAPSVRSRSESGAIWVRVGLPDQAREAWSSVVAAVEWVLGFPLRLGSSGPHVTLLSLGEQPAGQQEAALKETQEQVSAVMRDQEPGWLVFDRIQVFAEAEGKEEIPVVLMSGAETRSDAAWWPHSIGERLLRRLAHRVQEAQPDRYLPHLTLGYVPSNALPRAKAADLMAIQVSPVSWTATAVEVVSGSGEPYVVPAMAGSGRLRSADLRAATARLLADDGSTLMQARARDAGEGREERMRRAYSESLKRTYADVGDELARYVGEIERAFREAAPDPLALPHRSAR